MIPELSIKLRSSAGGELGFRIIQFEDDRHFSVVQRVPHFSVILVSEGGGKLKADFADYEISKGVILFFSPSQPFMIEATMVKGVMVNFHPDFFCIFRHQNEVAAQGILFNNPINPPFFRIPESESAAIYKIIEQITDEMQFAGLAQQDVLIAYLKILLIRAIRIRLLTTGVPLPPDQGAADAHLLRELKRMIELHFRTKHSGGEYAALLNVSLKKLGRVAKNYFQRTLTEVIADRIVMEAKRELNFTSKTLKEIGYYLGFDDKYHFSRYFKNRTGVSPESYRNSLKMAPGRKLRF